MAKESINSKKQRAAEISSILDKVYPDQPTLLDWWNDPFKLVIAVSLSAQTTDAAVNKVTPTLWKKYPSVSKLANAKVNDVQEIIRSIGFYKNKSKNAINCAKMIMNDFDGKVPSTMNELTKLPGVGRKTANVIMSTAFKKCEGIAVDTHVFRITHRLGLVSQKIETPQKTEIELLKIFPKNTWINLNHQLVRFGREICSAKNPRCVNDCVINKNLECPLCDFCKKLI